MRLLFSKLLFCILFLALTGTTGCSPKIKLFGSAEDPLKEFTLSGKGADKVLLVPVRGTISIAPKSGLLGEKPSLVQQVEARLEHAAKDKSIKAVVFTIDSPGGSTTASDILYERIMRYKKKSGAKTVAALMGVAASGGYYTAAACDFILAHPTTLTGSIGTIYIRPDITGLMDKIGVKTEINKSGKYKDMSSYFRESTPREQEMMQTMIHDLNSRFLHVVQTSRSLNTKQMELISDARVFSATQAKQAGLVDTIGYVEDALDKAKKMAGLAKDAKVVVLRRNVYANDTLYNTASSQYQGKPFSLIDSGLADFLTVPRTGFYFLWAPEYVQ